MNTKDIRNAMKAQLLGGAVADTAWPNVKDSGTTPRLEVEFTGVRQEGGTLKGNEVHYEEGTMMVIVAAAKGGGTDAGLDLAGAVAARFPEGSRLTITGGTVTIMARPDIRGGFPDDTNYRIPVAIRYRARNT